VGDQIGRAVALQAATPPGAGTVPYWSYPPIPSGVEQRLAERISTRPADQDNVVSYLALTAPAVLASVATGYLNAMRQFASTR
jgi:hypothetical protein